MQAEIIAIGDELTSGARLDTNSQWLSQQLRDLGIKVLAHTTVADDLDTMVDTIRRSANRSQVIICSGGLGPTADDLTREAVARATNCELVRDEKVLQHIKSIFTIRNREMPERNQIQADFPANSTVIKNPHGTAPGFCKTVENEDFDSQIITLPGVPAELKEMWSDSVRAMIEGWIGRNRKTIMHRSIKCFGAGESDIEQRLPDLVRRGQTPTVGITASKATITLRISAESDNEYNCQNQIQRTEKTILDCLGDLVYGFEEQTLEEVLLSQISSRNQTLSSLEIATNGLMANWLAIADRNKDQRKSSTFLGGLTFPNLPTASQYFQLDPTPPQINNSQIENALKTIATSLSQKKQTEYALVMGPPPEPNEQNPQIAVAIHTPHGPESKSFSYRSHPSIIHDRAAKALLNFLRLNLKSQNQ